MKPYKPFGTVIARKLPSEVEWRFLVGHPSEYKFDIDKRRATIFLPEDEEKVSFISDALLDEGYQVQLCGLFSFDIILNGRL